MEDSAMDDGVLMAMEECNGSGSMNGRQCNG